MDGAGADFLAGAGLPEHENGRIVSGDLPDQRDDVADEYRGAGGETRTAIIEGGDSRKAGLCLAP